jgi:hypothetical protein
VQNSTLEASYPRARPDLVFQPVGGLLALTDRSGAKTERLNLIAARSGPTATVGMRRTPLRKPARATCRTPGDDVPERVAAVLAGFSSRGMLG